MPIITLNGVGQRRRGVEPQQRQTGLSPQQTLSKCMMQSHQVENPYDVHGIQPTKKLSQNRSSVKGKGARFG